MFEAPDARSGKSMDMPMLPFQLMLLFHMLNLANGHDKPTEAYIASYDLMT